MFFYMASLFLSVCALNFIMHFFIFPLISLQFHSPQVTTEFHELLQTDFLIDPVIDFCLKSLSSCRRCIRVCGSIFRAFDLRLPGPKFIKTNARIPLTRPNPKTVSTFVSTLFWASAKSTWSGTSRKPETPSFFIIGG